MPDLRRHSIRRWLLWVLSLSLAAVMAINGWVQFLTANRPIHAAFDHALLDDAYAVAAYVRARSQGLSFELPAGAEDVLRTDPDDAFYFLVLGPRGEYLAGDKDLTVPARLLPGRDPVFETSYRGELVRGVLHLHPTPLGDVTVHVAQTLRARHQLEAEVAAGLLLSNGLLIGITLAIVYALVGAGLKPLLRLQAEIEAREANALDPVSERGMPLEVLPLARALNRLLRLVHDSSIAQRRFLADASHQLRTPLAGIQGQLELLSHEDLAPVQKERILSLHEASRRLSHLANRLLALARSEAQANPMTEMEAMDLAEVVEESAASFLDRAVDKQIDIGFEAGPAPVMGCGWMLREMAHNLVDNAIGYTPKGGRVTVRSRVLGSEAMFEVEDDGPGIPDVDRKRIFERFYRGTQASALGCGLGLAIVKEIAEVHRAKVVVARGAGGQGALFTVAFPVASAATAL